MYLVFSCVFIVDFWFFPALHIIFPSRARAYLLSFAFYFGIGACVLSCNLIRVFISYWLKWWNKIDIYRIMKSTCKYIHSGILLFLCVCLLYWLGLYGLYGPFFARVFPLATSKIKKNPKIETKEKQINKSHKPKWIILCIRNQLRFNIRASATSNPKTTEWYINLYIEVVHQCRHGRCRCCCSIRHERREKSVESNWQRRGKKIQNRLSFAKLCQCHIMFDWIFAVCYLHWRSPIHVRLSCP